MRTRTAIAITAGLLTALTACSSSGGSSTTAAPAAAAPASAQPPAPASSSAPAKALDAAGITAKLATTIPSVKLTVTYDATSDPNGRLGRQHQYSSKTAFDDTRVSNDPKAKEDATKDRRDSISYGGTVEVFDTAEDAKAWMDYVDNAQQSLGGLLKPDYLYRHEAVVVRVSHLLTPDQAKQYEQGIS